MGPLTPGHLECEEFEECWDLGVEPANWCESLGGDKRNACHVQRLQSMAVVAVLPLTVSSEPITGLVWLRCSFVGEKRATEFLAIPLFMRC